MSCPCPTIATAAVRLRLALRGAVQGVGFRPFVFRLASELGLAGWVSNSPQGVRIEVEGGREILEMFLHRLEVEKPPASFIQSLEASWLDAVGLVGFEIRTSDQTGDKSALVLPDLATCLDCRREIFDPANRRFRYPFTNCTHCGPRFSIITALPYDRANTTMSGFTMCPACQAEYDAPRDRRFHAQPNACAVCGPRLTFAEGASVPVYAEAALAAAEAAIRDGKIVAVKGVGGFHLMVDARNAGAVERLRARKHREEKPFALLFPSIEAIREVCRVSPLEERLLTSSVAPIVLLRRDAIGSVASAVAPGNPQLGVMLPSNPLHHLLMVDLNFPVVATSGNLSDEPICTEEAEARERLQGIADAFLTHDRPIVRQVDDSIVREMLGREMVLRRARGYAPLPVTLKTDGLSAAPTVLAVGAHLKNTVALAVGESVFLSQHIGDLETEAAYQAFRRVAADLPRLYAAPPAIMAADLHPDYLSTQFAAELTRPNKSDNGAHPIYLGVQHHVAHVLSCIAENEVPLPALGVAWDGTGWGPDGVIWGGEFFRVATTDVKRVAHLRPFRLPGGEAAVREPRRVALGLLFELFGEDVFARNDLPVLKAFTAAELAGLRTLLKRGLNAPWTTSVGRLFDGVAALAGLRQRLRFEGQAAMELEFAAGDDDFVGAGPGYELALSVAGSTGPSVLDWAPLVRVILSDVQNGVLVDIISAKFHSALAEAVVMVARQAGEARVVLSGGCFQNRRLTEQVVARLRQESFQPYWHQRVPANDGGLALGQVFAARNQLTLK